jgi:hypothetical protein
MRCGKPSLEGKIRSPGEENQSVNVDDRVRFKSFTRHRQPVRWREAQEGDGRARDGKGTVVNLEAQQYLGRAEHLFRQTGAALLACRLETLRTDMEARLH